MKKLLISILIFTVILLLVYSFFIEPNMLIVKKYHIKDEALKGIKIVFIGDLHIQPDQSKRLNKIVDLANEQKPDIVLSVGDFVNGQTEKSTLPVDKIISDIKNIKTKYGIYTVLGNHDWWFDGKRVTDTCKSNGIKVLANSNTKINVNGKEIYIAGVEDLSTGTPDVNKALEGTKNPVILLTHSPDVFPNIPKNVNLTLAGHLHGGQVRLPLWGAIIIPSYYGDKYAYGLIEEKRKKMIVTMGIGTSILNVRFACVPEIVVIEFE